ncbi:branched-chain amino acid ABC transporter permease [Xanthobacteraceae bacterium A53D]
MSLSARRGAIAVACLAALVIAAFPAGPYAASLINWMAIAALIGASMRLVLLFGELNFAVAAFVGIGAYAAGMATTYFNLAFPIALLSAGIVAAAVSVVFGYVTLRVKGPYFKLIGFAFAEVVRICYTQSNWVGGNSGIVGIFPPMALDRWMGVVVVGIVIVMLLALYALEKSDFGKLLYAIRDNDSVVTTVGINVRWVKVACFSVACFSAGIAGALQAFVNNVISPGDFGFMLSVFALAYLKVGGEGSPVGPVVGAILMVGMGSVALSFGAGEHVLYGLAIVLAVLFLPSGVVGLFQKLVRPRRKVAGGHHLPRPSGV